jgi:hypothetical protein
MSLKHLSASFCAALLIGSAVTDIDRAAAATIQFASPNWVFNNSDPSLQPNWLVAIDDETAGSFRVNLSIASPTSATGDMLGFGFDTALTGLLQSQLVFVSSSTGEGITGLFSDSLSCGPGCNFNGDGRTAFDFIVRMGDQGSSNGLITAFQLLIPNLAGVSLPEAFTRVGIRAQSVGENGSTKDVNSTPGESLLPIPVPAALPLFLSALGLFGFIGWGKRTRALAV